MAIASLQVKLDMIPSFSVDCFGICFPHGISRTYDESYDEYVPHMHTHTHAPTATGCRQVDSTFGLDCDNAKTIYGYSCSVLQTVYRFNCRGCKSCVAPTTPGAFGGLAKGEQGIGAGFGV